MESRCFFDAFEEVRSVAGRIQGIIGGFVQMLCFAVCLASAFVSVKALTKGGKGKDKFKYIVNVPGNASFAAAMAVFELMKFWSV